MSMPDTNPEVLLNLSEWIGRRKDSIGAYADHIVHSVRHYEAAIRALAAERDQLAEKLVAANAVIAKEQGEVLQLRKTVKGLRAQTTRLMCDDEPRTAPTSVQKVHESWPAPFHEGFWAIVNAEGEIQGGAFGWAISPEGELEAWQRLVEPCDQSTVELAKERGRRAVFFPAANSLQKTQTIQEE